MTVINVYDMSFNLIGVVDEFSSLIWRPAYYAVGDFEIYVGATDRLVDLLKENRLVVRNSDISIDEYGNVTYKNVMIIKNIEIKTDVEKGDYLTVTGKELKYLLHQRIVWNQTNLSGNAEAAIRALVTDNAIAPTDNKRIIPGLLLGASANLTDNVDKQITGEPLDKAITEICTTYNYGWEVYGYNNTYVFRLYKGTDRSYGQNDNMYVVFSDTFDNLYRTDYQLKSENFANTALVGGEGEGTERKYGTVGGDNAGLERYETFVDAKSVSSNRGAISASTYTSMLQDKGNEKLAELGIKEGFSGEVLSSDGNYIYGADFFLGDIVTVINSYTIIKNVQVLSAIESENAKGRQLIPQFNF